MDMELSVNGAVTRHSNTVGMIFSVAQIISCLSRCMTLLPGDAMMTDMQAGVGLDKKPPLFLKKGHMATLKIDQLGTQTQNVV